MPESKSLQRTEPDAPVRTLKIEADGDFSKGLIKPKIRITGQWLERAGFNPGSHVQVTRIAWHAPPKRSDRNEAKRL
jgi:hypothetical protein